jgi:predicted RNA binding protein YcfA (HicA-like mRNA interferase family)
MVHDHSSKQNQRAKLGKIKNQKTWIHAIQKLGFLVEPGKGSHFVARNTLYPKSDYRSLIVVIQHDIRKDVSESIFKELVKKGVSENDIFDALGLD